MSNKEFLEKAFDFYQIKDKSWTDILIKYVVFEKEKLCCYLANVFHETACLKKLEESFKYSVDGLKKNKRFTQEEAEKYGYIGDGKTGKYTQEPNQEMIANIMYNRKDLGNLEFGDGYKFRGRGLFQLTGRYNYSLYGKELNIDLINNPDLVSKDKEIAIKTSLLFWKLNNLDNLFSQQDGFKKVRKAINGGENGLDDCNKKYQDLISLC